MQLLMYDVCPFGERREDIRSAVMTANIMVSNAKIDEGEFGKVIQRLANYLPALNKPDLPIDTTILTNMPDAR